MKPSRTSVWLRTYGNSLFGGVIISVAILIATATIATWCVSYETCVVGGHAFVGEGEQLKEYWLCNEHWSRIDFEAGRALNKSGTWAGGTFEQKDQERTKWILSELKRFCDE